MSSDRHAASLRPFHPEITELDDSLTCREVVEMLEGLRFIKPPRRLLEIDKGIRDHLLHALRRR
jgi:hypothetical protein